MREFLLNKIKAAGTTVGDVYFPNVICLLSFDGSNGSTSITDNSNGNHTVTVNSNAQISTAASKFGGSSLLLDGSGDRLTINAVADAMDSNIHTIEFWFNTSSSDYSGDPSFFGFNDSSNSYDNDLMLQATSSTALRLYHTSGSSYTTVTVGAINDGEWHHLALVSDGTDYDLYIDGTRVANNIGTAVTIVDSDTFMIGAEYDGSAALGNYFNGYIDDFRITNGVARYSGASFTPPTTAHLTSAGDVNKQILINSTADGVAIGTGGINQARISKAWVEFDGSGITINASYNVSSITDHGNRDYTINFSTTMTDAYYSIVGSNIGQTSSYNWSVVTGMGTAKTTSAARINVPHINDSSLYANDPNTVNIIVFGN
jgi:hypothetical protein